VREIEQIKNILTTTVLHLDSIIASRKRGKVEGVIIQMELEKEYGG
jgi:hypothetical protein